MRQTTNGACLPAAAGRHEVVDLIPNGRNTMVTDENKLEYVQRITHHRMTHSIRGQIEAFLEGV